MFNKIKNFFNRSKKAIDNKCNEIYCKAQTAVANAKAEFYIDKTVGIIIAVVVGVLLMGIAESKRISAGFLILTISARRTVARGISASLPRRWSASEPSIMKVPKNTRSGRIWIWTWTIGGTIYGRSTRNLTKMDCMQAGKRIG